MTSRVCATRAHKNLAQLRRAAPLVFAEPEPTEGYASIAPIGVLARLERSEGELRRLVRSWPLAPASPPRLARPGSSAVGPLFSGAMWLVALRLGTSNGPQQLDPADVSTIQNYLRLALPPIVRYAGQYGSTRATLSDRLLTYSASVPTGVYNDQTVQAWANELAKVGGIGAEDCVIFVNPTEARNTDAPVEQGVLGYHGKALVPYIFVNVIGASFTVTDAADQFALAMSHEVAEMIVDPSADSSNPEVCDPCGPNCQSPFRDYFDASGTYLSTTTTFPPGPPYGFFLNAIVRPSSASSCPAPPSACVYAPP